MQKQGYFQKPLCENKELPKAIRFCRDRYQESRNYKSLFLQLIMKILSLDPRISRAEIPDGVVELKPMDEFQTYEVFHQKKRGEQHEHVGIVHAPNDEMALLFAKRTISYSYGICGRQ